MVDINKLLEELTIEEKASLISGHKSWFTNQISRLNIPKIMMTDGPHGLRKKREDGKAVLNGLGDSEISTCFPPAVTSASSFNKDLMFKMGEAMGKECNYYDVHVILGPAMNIKRNPLCGRNFEYFSEDPLVSGVMATELTKGIESRNVGTSLKHYAANNNEANRYFGDSIVDDRSLREIYLRGFERVVKQAHPKTIMCAYNKVNGEFASENKELLTDILRTEWGFNGLVMSDWGAVNDRVKGVKAGLDLEMPGDVGHNRQVIVDAYKSGDLTEEELNEAVRNVLNMVYSSLEYEKPEELDFEAHAKLSKQLSLDSAVLLKNEENILPLSKNGKYLIIGELFEKMRYQGAGSSLIRPWKVVSPKEAFENNNIDFNYVKGYKVLDFEVNKELQEEALLQAQNYETILFFGGLSELAESEGIDRKTLSLPNNQVELLNQLSALGKNIIFVMYGGSPVIIPAYNDIKGILNMYLPGQMGGESTYDLLFGDVSPSGRLAETWPLELTDVPFINEFTKTNNDLYKEGLFVGYRYFDSFNKNVRFPFGYGLSYSKFNYDNLSVFKNGNKVVVRVDVTNTGDMKAKEAVQIFVKAPKSKVIKPIHELRGFTKVELEPNETKTAIVEIDINDLNVYINNNWVLENGTYTIQVCKNSNQVLLEKEIELKSEDTIIPNNFEYEIYSNHDRFINMTDDEFKAISKKEFEHIEHKNPYDLNTPINQYKTFWGRKIYKLMMFVVNRVYKKALKSKEDEHKETRVKNAYFTMQMLKTLSVRSLSYASEGMLSHRMATGILDIANGKFFRGLWKIITKEKVFKLPE